MNQKLLRHSFVRCARLLVRESQLLEKRAFASRMTKIIKIKDADQVVLDKAVEEAVSVLSSGGVIATPTETVYGVAASVNSNEGIQRLYTIKGRRESKPIAICLSEVEDIAKWTKCTVSFDLLHDLLPGPVTTVLERGVDLNPQLNPGNPLVGIRVPAHSFMRKLVARCGYPLALTSANVSNTTSTLDIEEFQQLWPQLDLVIDGGRITVGEGQEESPESRRGSTVVNLSQPGKFSIIREGRYV